MSSRKIPWFCTWHCQPGASSINDGTPSTTVTIPNSRPMPMTRTVALSPDKSLHRDALSRVRPASTFTSLSKTISATLTTLKIYTWSSLIGLAQAVAVDQSSQAPTARNKTTDVLPSVLFSVMLVASVVAVWWVRRRATNRVADRGMLAPRTPSQYRPLSIPLPVYLTSRAPYVTFNTTNALTTAPINIVTPRARSHWTRPEIVLAGLSIILTVIGLVLTGLSLLYAQRAVPKA